MYWRAVVIYVRESHPVRPPTPDVFGRKIADELTADAIHAQRSYVTETWRTVSMLRSPS